MISKLPFHFTNWYILSKQEHLLYKYNSFGRAVWVNFKVGFKHK